MKSRRHKIRQRRAKKLFSRTAAKVKGLNLRATPMRGGFRI